MKSGNVFCQSLCTRRANGSKQQASYQFTSFFGTKGVKQGIDRPRGQGTGIPTTLLQDSVKKGTVNAATTLKQYKVVQRYKVVQKKTSCPKTCCQTLQFANIWTTHFVLWVFAWHMVQQFLSFRDCKCKWGNWPPLPA